MYCRKNNLPSERCRYKFDDRYDRNNNNKTAYFVENYVSEDNDVRNKQVFSLFITGSFCNSHLSHEREIMSDVRKTENDQINVSKKGQLLQSNILRNVDTPNVLLANVLHVPELTRNLLLVNAVTSKGGVVIFDDKSFKVFHDAQVQVKGGYMSIEGKKNNNDLYEVDLKNEYKQEAYLTQQEATQ